MHNTTTVRNPADHAGWERIWRDADRSYMGEPVPVFQETKAQSRHLPHGGMVHYAPFLCTQGLDPMKYRSKKYATRLAHMLATPSLFGAIGLPPTGSAFNIDGRRHPMGFALVYTDVPFDSNPADIWLDDDSANARLIFGVLMGNAFASARLPRPEVVSAEPLTVADSPGHIWKVRVRFYDGTTFRRVASQLDVFRSSLGHVPWLRVREVEDGCEFVMGATPDTLEGHLATEQLEELNALEEPSTPGSLATLIRGINAHGFAVTLSPLNTVPEQED